ncbi:DUF853 family protein [Arthrobacter echini]|uniref:DUF853 family protein n=1 Tax=Arthrobacter echini TaxID=1529066 RepID=A0A5D0XUD3_9MICC|nr:helicase HerA-like domain-containing protein [Arthrobacter echini]TYD00334.1 DUF853 family protein [Arthrobacter echini]
MAEHDATAQLADITAGYVFGGPTLQLGAALVDGELHAEAQVRLPLAMMNRHGLIAGATGTGKTVTLQVMAEQLSTHGVPVFLSDIKGDLTGLSTPGTASDRVSERTESVGQDWSPAGFPVEFLSLGADGDGVPVRATISSFGPLLLSRVMDLNETQESSLQLVFHYADRNGLELYDLTDLRAVITFLTSDEGKDGLASLGGLSKSTAGVILRELVTLEAQGMDSFFGEPEFDTADLLRTAADGRGIISCLELATVQQQPRLFSTFLMWLLADLFAELPEIGDVDKPRLVFFLDEAHLLFTGSSKAFRESIQATVRLIRSKGVGIFFITQTPKDLPGEVLGQLANRVQHALRAFTPDDAKALRATVSTFPISPYDLEEVLTSAGIGEAVITVMNDRGAPTPVAWTRLRSPQSVMGRAPEGTVSAVVAASALLPRYREAVDSHSAAEKLTGRAAAGAVPTVASPGSPGGAGPSAPGPDHDDEARRIEEDILGAPSRPSGSGAEPSGAECRPGPGPDRRAPARSRETTDMADLALQAAGVIGRELARGLFGTQRRRRRR